MTLTCSRVLNVSDVSKVGCIWNTQTPHTMSMSPFLERERGREGEREREVGRERGGREGRGERERERERERGGGGREGVYVKVKRLRRGVNLTEKCL